MFFFFPEISETPPKQFFFPKKFYLLFWLKIVKYAELCPVCKLSFRVSTLPDSTIAIDLKLLIKGEGTLTSWVFFYV